MSLVLCRTCMRPITKETRTEEGYKPREGWYDDCRSDPIVCFKASRYRHVPLTDRERAYYDAGRAEGWDAGYNSGVADAFTSMDFDGGNTPPARVNPHRSAQS